VITVINSPADGDAGVRAQNERTLEEASTWIARHADPRLTFHLLNFPDLPPKQAGVGLARKIGMDEALRRLDDAGQDREGLMVGFDADCRCERNYLTSIERHFQRHECSPGASIYFEHPLAGPLEPRLYEAVTAYELHLRYYVQALRFAGFRHAYHTVGSSMVVRADTYRKQGGMNKRQAGEDFYFLHKIIPLGGYTDLTDTTVIPSPRGSDRVPFGTGRAVRACLSGEELRTYPLESFRDLKIFLEQLPVISRGEETSALPLPDSVRTFLKVQRFAETLAEIRANTRDEAAFRKRFHHWFNGFQAMKFIHHARDQFYGEGEVGKEAGELLKLLPGAHQQSAGASLQSLLFQYRALDKASANAWYCGSEL